MKIIDSEYANQKSFLNGLVTLGGLSECGKTSAGVHLESIGFDRIKIIQIEREMMLERKFDLSNGMADYHFIELYKGEPHHVFKEFLIRLIDRIKANNKKYVTIESLYRAPLGAFLKAELQEKAVDIYIYAPIEVRAQRELIKINQNNASNDLPKIEFADVLKRIEQKDLFKTRHNAFECRDIADVVIDNGTNTSYDDFISELNSIVKTKLSFK